MRSQQLDRVGIESSLVLMIYAPISQNGPFFRAELAVMKP